MKFISHVLRAVFLGVISAGGVYAAESESGAAAISTSMTISEIIQTGGWIMYVLGLMSIAGLALIIYAFIVLRPDKIIPLEFTDSLRKFLQRDQLEEARTYCRSQPSPASAVALAALDYTERVNEPDPAMIKEIIEGEGSRQASAIQQQTSYLLDIGVIAPMVGLLGTVLGMLTAFNAVALDIARAKPIYLAAGVSQALVTTAAGLLVGIPAMIFYAYFRGRSGKLIGQLEMVSADMLTELIKGKDA